MILFYAWLARETQYASSGKNPTGLFRNQKHPLTIVTL